MILKYYGHAFFSLSLENGTEIAFDPYDGFYQYPKRNVRADICLMSHHHYDHDSVASVSADALLIDQPGVHKPAEGVTIRGISTWHDEVQGAKRGANTFYVVEAEGMRIGHAGDLGHVPTAAQRAQIGRLDVLMLPVGGYYTIDCQTALEVCRLLQPTVMIPMHYRTEYDEEMPIADLNDFLKMARAEDTQMPLVRLVQADMSERAEILTLKIS